jgi:hypothetical protein
MLTGPTTGARKIARLTMTARFIIQGDLDRLDLPEPLALTNSAHELAGLPVLIKRVNKVVEGQYAYEITVQRGRKTPAEWALITPMLQQFPCKLVDVDGNALHFRGGSTSQSPGQVTMTHTVTRDGGGGRAKIGEPVKFVSEVPSDLAQILVPLEFRDVSLP